MGPPYPGENVPQIVTSPLSPLLSPFSLLSGTLGPEQAERVWPVFVPTSLTFFLPELVPTASGGGKERNFSVTGTWTRLVLSWSDFPI